jgi:hypothetical protein
MRNVWTFNQLGGIVRLMDAKFAWIATLVLLAGAIVFTPSQARELYRWVDEEGSVHYSETLPPESSTRPHDKLSDRGIVVESVEDPVAAAKLPVVEPEAKKKKKKELVPLYTDAQIQTMSDRLLVLKYHSEKDILDAMHVEIDNLGYDARMIEQGRTSILRSLRGQVSKAADLERAGKPVEKDTINTISHLRARLEKGDEGMAHLQEREESIRAMFNSDLERYRSLLEIEADSQSG